MGCGKKISNESKFCTHCGEKFSVRDETKSKNSSVKNRDVDDSQLLDEKINQADLIPDGEKSAANGMISKGLGFLAAGLIITWISYSTTKPGGTYFIFWGLPIYGAYLFIKGLLYRSEEKSEEKENKNTKKKSGLHWE